jgi:hypothetical protein
MVVECSFGSIVTKFRLLGKAIETNVENAVHIEKSITLLHRFGGFNRTRCAQIHSSKSRPEGIYATIKDKQCINQESCVGKKEILQVFQALSFGAYIDLIQLHQCTV